MHPIALWTFAIIGMACVATSVGLLVMVTLGEVHDRRRKAKTAIVTGGTAPAEEAAIQRARELLAP